MNGFTDYERSGIKMTAKWGGIEMTAYDSSKSEEKVHWVYESGEMMHKPWYSGRDKVKSEQGGGVLEVENGAWNATSLEDFASLGKSSVIKKEF